MHREPRLNRLCMLGLAASLAASACASDEAHGAGRGTTPERAVAPQPGVGVTQAELEAARRHPIAQPEARPVYPAQHPPTREARGLPEQAPPPREHGVPAQAPRPAESPAATTAPAETRVVAPQAPPEPYTEQPPAAPAPDYVWAPGYWYWYGGSYVWVPGAWLPPRRGYVFVSARWMYTSDGWMFVPGGWAVAGGGVVVVPVHRHHYLYHAPYSSWHHHHHRDHGRSWYGGRGHRDHGHVNDHRHRSSNRTWVSPRNSYGNHSRSSGSGHYDRGRGRTFTQPYDRGSPRSNRSMVRPSAPSGTSSPGRRSEARLR